MSIPSSSVSSTEAELEAVLRLAAARGILDAALMGDRDWLAGDVLHCLARLVDVAGSWMDRAEAAA